MKKYVLFTMILFMLCGCEKTSMKCLKGYNFDESTNKCTRTVEAEAVINYYCEGKNEVIEGEKCKKTVTSQAKTKKVCNPGYYLDGGLCVKDGTIANFQVCGVAKTYSTKTKECYDKVSAITMYTCEVGEVEGSTCVEITYSDALQEYVCEDNKYSLKGDKCYYTIEMDATKEAD